MLKSVSRFSSFFNVTVNGKQYEAVAGETIEHLCKRNHEYIPKFCHNPIFKCDHCNLCKVLVDGKQVKNACDTFVYEKLILKQCHLKLQKNSTNL